MLVFALFSVAATHAAECKSDALKNRFALVLKNEDIFDKLDMSTGLGEVKYFDGYPGEIELYKAYKATTDVTKRKAIAQQYADNIIYSSYRKGARIFYIAFGHWPELTPSTKLWLERLDAFNKKYPNDKYRLRIGHSPNAYIMQLGLSALDVYKPENRDALLNSQGYTSVSNLLKWTPQDANELRSVLPDPCYGPGFIDGWDTKRKVFCYTDKQVDTSKLFRARVGLVKEGSTLESNFIDEMTADLSKRWVQNFLALNLGLTLDAIKAKAPNTPIYEVVLGYQSSSGESTIINGRDALAPKIDYEMIVSFQAAPLRSIMDIPVFYRHYRAIDSIWASATKIFARVIKSKVPSAYVAMYAHPNMSFINSGILDAGDFYVNAGVDMLESSWMPPAPPHADSLSVQDQLTFTASIAKHAKAVWRMDYSCPTSIWTFDDKGWKEGRLASNKFTLNDQDGDGSPENIDVTMGWDRTFLSSQGYPSGVENARHYLTEAIASAKLGGCGMNYANWPGHWFSKGLKSDGLLELSDPASATGVRDWAHLIGGTSANPDSAYDRLKRSWKANDYSDVNTVAVYVNSVARFNGELVGFKRDRSVKPFVAPRTYALAANYARINSKASRVEFITDGNIFNDASLLNRYSKIYFFEVLSDLPKDPWGIFSSIWDTDPRSATVKTRLNSVSSKIVRVNTHLDSYMKSGLIEE